MKFNVDRADIGFAIPRESQDRSIAISREKTRRLRRDTRALFVAPQPRVSSGSSALYGRATTWQVQPRRPVGPFFPLPASAAVSSSFFSILPPPLATDIHRRSFSSRSPLEQLTTGQPWPTDCTPSPTPRVKLIDRSHVPSSSRFPSSLLPRESC